MLHAEAHGSRALHGCQVQGAGVDVAAQQGVAAPALASILGVLSGFPPAPSIKVRPPAAQWMVKPVPLAAAHVSAA